MFLVCFWCSLGDAIVLLAKCFMTCKLDLDLDVGMIFHLWRCGYINVSGILRLSAPDNQLVPVLSFHNFFSWCLSSIVNFWMRSFVCWMRIILFILSWSLCAVVFVVLSWCHLVKIERLVTAPCECWLCSRDVPDWPSYVVQKVVRIAPGGAQIQSWHPSCAHGCVKSMIQTKKHATHIHARAPQILYGCCSVADYLLMLFVWLCVLVSCFIDVGRLCVHVFGSLLKHVLVIFHNFSGATCRRVLHHGHVKY